MAQRDHFLTLDGLRGVAAVAVVLYHIGAQLGAPLAPAAFLAVDLFFVLSGFVIAHAYEARLTSGMSFREFSWIRFKRLYPLYVAGLGLGLVYGLLAWRGQWEGFQTLPQLAATVGFGLFMLPAPEALSGSSILFPLNIPAWSLFFELCANLLYGLGAARLRGRTLTAFIGICLVGLLAAGAVFDGIGGGTHWHDGWSGFIRVGFAFFAGVGLFRLLRGRPMRTSNTLAAASLLALGGVLVFMPNGGWRDLALAIVAFPGLVALCAQVQPTGALAGACAWLGKVSYSLYITHSPLLGGMALVLGAAGLGDLPTGPAILVRLVPVLVFAVVADALWDVPVRRWLSRLGTRRPAAAAGATLPSRPGGQA